jgi:hypothetical protein
MNIKKSLMIPALLLAVGAERQGFCNFNHKEGLKVLCAYPNAKQDKKTGNYEGVVEKYLIENIMRLKGESPDKANMNKIYPVYCYAARTGTTQLERLEKHFGKGLINNVRKWMKLINNKHSITMRVPADLKELYEKNGHDGNIDPKKMGHFGYYEVSRSEKDKDSTGSLDGKYIKDDLGQKIPKAAHSKGTEYPSDINVLKQQADEKAEKLQQVKDEKAEKLQQEEDEKAEKLQQEKDEKAAQEEKKKKKEEKKKKKEEKRKKKLKELTENNLYNFVCVQGTPQGGTITLSPQDPQGFKPIKYGEETGFKNAGHFIPMTSDEKTVTTYGDYACQEKFGELSGVWKIFVKTQEGNEGFVHKKPIINKKIEELIASGEAAWENDKDNRHSDPKDNNDRKDNNNNTPSDKDGHHFVIA